MCVCIYKSACLCLALRNNVMVCDYGVLSHKACFAAAYHTGLLTHAHALCFLEWNHMVARATSHTSHKAAVRTVISLQLHAIYVLVLTVLFCVCFSVGMSAPAAPAAAMSSGAQEKADITKILLKEKMDQRKRELEEKRLRREAFGEVCVPVCVCACVFVFAVQSR